MLADWCLGLEFREEIFEILYFGVKVEVEGQLVVGGDFVDLGEDVYVGKVHLKHGTETEEDVGDIEGRLRDAERVGEVYYYELSEVVLAIPHAVGLVGRITTVDSLDTRASVASGICFSKSCGAYTAPPVPGSQI